MHTSLHRSVIVGLGVFVLIAALAPAAQALPAPSKTAADQALTERAKDLASLDSLMDQKEVMAVLAGQGFTRDEVNQRLAQLSPDEHNALATQTDQLQAAGQPMYIWILIAVLIVVAIVAVAG